MRNSSTSRFYIYITSETVSMNLGVRFVEKCSPMVHIGGWTFVWNIRPQLVRGKSIAVFQWISCSLHFDKYRNYKIIKILLSDSSITNKRLNNSWYNQKIKHFEKTKTVGAFHQIDRVYTYCICLFVKRKDTYVC